MKFEMYVCDHSFYYKDEWPERPKLGNCGGVQRDAHISSLFAKKLDERGRMETSLSMVKEAGMNSMMTFVDDNFDLYLEVANEVGLDVYPEIMPIVRHEYPGAPQGEGVPFWKKITCVNSAEVRANAVEIVKKAISDYQGRVPGLDIDVFRDLNATFTWDAPCECPACRDINNYWFGHPKLTDEERKNPAVIYKVLEVKNNHLTNLLRELRQLTNAANMKMCLATRSCYANQPNITREPVKGLGPALIEGQDWIKWAHEDLLDHAGPMSYYIDESEFTQTLNDHVRLMGDKKEKLKPGIGVYSSVGKVPPVMIERYIQQCIEHGLRHCYFFALAHFFPDDFAAIKNVKNLDI